MKILTILILTLLFSACSSDEQVNPNLIKIGISKGSGSESYANYAKWLIAADADVEVIDMWELSPEQAVSKLADCDGLLLTGGPDVHPKHFGKESDTARCSIDEYRDSLEFALINKAREMQIPIFGICRGMQILNVAFGGSLIIDIPEDILDNETHQIEEKDAFHKISILPNTKLYSITRQLNLEVNSNHHQAVENLAEGFTITAQTSDNIPEAMEFSNFNKQYISAVQWHPERMDYQSEGSLKLAIDFLTRVREQKTKN